MPTPWVCHNCEEAHVRFRDHCLLELLGVVLLERGYEDAQVRTMLASLCPVTTWETFINEIVEPLEAQFPPAEV